MSEVAEATPSFLALAQRPARLADPAQMPWTPLGEGFSFKPLRFLADDRGYAALLRLEPGTVIPLHRHTGEIHAINVEGSRRLSSGEVIGPGGYVFEPAGNVDSWKAVGETPLVVMIVVTGAVEYIEPDGTVTVRSSGKTLEGLYRAHCAVQGLGALDLAER